MMIQKKEHQLQPKLSTILKHEISYISQAFGTFFDGMGKYCALAPCSRAVKIQN